MSTTVDAATYEYNYILYDSTSGKVFVSQYPIHVITKSASSSTSGIQGIGAITKGQVNDSTTQYMPAFEIIYSTSLEQWAASRESIYSEVRDSRYIFGEYTSQFWSQLVITTPISSCRIYTNVSWNSSERGQVASYSNDLTTLPEGLTEDVISGIIQDQLNRQTASGTTAAEIITDTSQKYSSYQAGSIDSETMQSYVSENLDTLSELSAITGNTLSDLMQINNALTYNQAIQDSLLHSASSNVQSMINGYMNTINNAVANYQNGTVSQSDTVNIINQSITNLNNMIINGTAKTTADINAVNAAINAANANLDSVTGYKDLSQDVSNKSQQSDAEELELLEEMVTEMQKEEIEQPFENQQTMSDAQTVRDSISDIWVNKYMIALTAMFGMLVIPCIILRTHYRMM